MFIFFQMNSLNFKLLGVVILLLALVCEISSVEEKKVLRRKKVLPSADEVEPNRDGHYRLQKKSNHPLIRDGKENIKIIRL
jgi:hypothetical protein